MKYIDEFRDGSVGLPEFDTIELPRELFYLSPAEVHVAGLGDVLCLRTER